MGRLSQVDMTQQTHPAVVGRPVLSSEQSGWNGLFHHYDHPAHESPDHQWMQHIIGIIGKGGHPIESEHRLDGQILTCYCQPGEMLFIPAGVRYSSNWHQAGEFSLPGFSPKFYWVSAKWILTTGLIIFGTFWLFPWGNAAEAIASTEGLNAFKNPIYLFDAKGVLIGSVIQVSFLFVIIGISVLKPWGRRTTKVKNLPL